MAAGRLPFGPRKYAAFHLLLSRWLRQTELATQYSYITLGGTELKDVENLFFVDPRLVSTATSFESNRSRHMLALERGIELRKAGVSVTAVNGDIFSCSRVSDDPHLFFFDFVGICTGSQYVEGFANLFQRYILREGDTFFITSYLGRNPGWPKVLDAFSVEFRLLEASSPAKQKEWYRRAHPSFTLFRALRQVDLDDQVRLDSLGCVEYCDKSPMGLYAYVVKAGRTTFRELITAAPHFHINRGFAETI